MTNTGNTRFTKVDVNWQEPKLKCEDADWPLPSTAYVLPEGAEPLERIVGLDAVREPAIPKVLQQQQEPLLKLRPGELEQSLPQSTQAASPSSH